MDLEVGPILERCQVVGECLLWTGATQKGYGAIRRSGKSYRLHRLFCELVHGPAPEGKPNALHRCGMRACIHADHLYWGDQVENAQDSAGRAGRPRSKVCAKGHRMTEENVYTPPSGARKCRECRKIAKRLWARENRKCAS